MEANEAQVNVTWSGKNGDLPDPVSYDATDGDVRGWITEAVRAGGVPGIPADPNADFRDYIIERYPAPANPVEGERNFNQIMIRPKTPFGT